MIIGIDLGTTNSLVACMRDGRPEVLTNELGERMTPSAVALAEDGLELVGRAAHDRLVREPSSGVRRFKRDMGTPATYRFGRRNWSPIECSARVLRELKRIAELRLEQPVERAVISVPAYFHDPPRQATLDAAELAGLKVERLINEPTAAALAHGFQERDAESELLVFDLGGGTFDVTVLELFEGVVDVRASAGISQLGGEDYSDALVSAVVERLGLKDDEAVRQALRPAVEVVKRRLAIEERAELEWDGRRVELGRDDLVKATAELTERLRPVLVRCLRDAELGFADLDGVILAGGATRMTLVRELLDEVGCPRC
ncbi:MAG: Hsp70 family protein [Acidobacteriota bacterium]